MPKKLHWIAWRLLANWYQIQPKEIKWVLMNFLWHLQLKRTLEKPHWVLISKEIIGRNKSYEDQQKIAEEENKKVPGTKISGIIDTVISLFMEYVRSGEINFIDDDLEVNEYVRSGVRYFIYDEDKNEHNRVRVNEKFGGWRTNLSFAPYGLYVGCGLDDARDEIGFVPARRFFKHID